MILDVKIYLNINLDFLYVWWKDINVWYWVYYKKGYFNWFNYSYLMLFCIYIYDVYICNLFLYRCVLRNVCILFMIY